MQFLIDTHAFLWFASGDARLSDLGRSAIADDTNDVFISVASVWEISIKVGNGKLQLDAPLAEFVERELPKYDLLEISVEHAIKVAFLPKHHRDPFDRMLVAQSLLEDLPLISADVVFDSYGVERLWESSKSS